MGPTQRQKGVNAVCATEKAGRSPDELPAQGGGTRGRFVHLDHHASDGARYIANKGSEGSPVTQAPKEASVSAPASPQHPAPGG